MAKKGVKELLTEDAAIFSCDLSEQLATNFLRGHAVKFTGIIPVCLPLRRIPGKRN